MRLSPAAFALACLAAACTGAGFAAVTRQSVTVRDASAAPLTLRTVVPAWRAPGVRVPLRGFAGSNETVALRVNGRVVDRTVSGPLGGFELAFRTGTPGRYRLGLAAGDRVRTIGTVTVRPVVLEAVGDITFGEQVGPALSEFGAAYPWRYVASTLRRADMTVGNLETSVSERGTASVKEYTFRGPPSALRPVHTLAGFDVLTLANNHSADFGKDALLDTVKAVHAAGMLSIGAGATSVRARRPAIVGEGGLRVAFLGYSDVNPLGFSATATSAGTAKADVAAVDADVRAARRRADVVVCFFHWGTELQANPDARQGLLADACLRSGASVVLGAHPHVFGPVSRPTPRTLVAWTLGNFVFPSSGITARTGILRVELGARGVSGYRMLPIAIDGFRPRPAGSYR
ncbi:MAG TPA: CapA family protein [Gaiellaceae bacterium]|nr:CapA family protein [Gaiellaceae bacterium]